ncbi:MAG: hypothetical protein K9H12_14500 [Bacteroidales bacterium]|nr:hypothetical protein [Bacteroidales bacterium]
MKKYLTLLTILVFTSAVNIFAQDLDEILDNYFEVVGQEKMLEFNTIILQGKAVQMGMEFPMTLTQKRPDKARMEAEIQGAKIIQAYNGVTGWSIIPMTGSMEPQDMGEQEVKGMKQMGDMDGDLYNWKEKGFDLTLVGEDDMEGTAVFKLKLVKPDGDEFIYFMDAENFVVLRVDTKIMMQGAQIESSSSFSNFKPVSGVIMAHSIEQKMNGQVMMQMVIDNVEINSEVSDSIFEKPTSN